MPKDMPERWLSTGEVAGLLGCSKESVVGKVRRGKLAAVKPEGLRGPLKFVLSAVLAYQQGAQPAVSYYRSREKNRPQGR
jgi:excisionase family DNA binding protein